MTNHDPDLVARLKDEIKRLNLECNALSQRNTLLVMELDRQSKFTPERLKAAIVKSFYECKG
jgi:hypothetical protein